MLYATVRNRKIHVKKPDTVVQNGVKVDWLQLEMDDEWAAMDSIVCVFVARYTEEQTGDGGTKTLVEQEIKKEMLHTFGQKVLVPWEVLVNSGMLSVSCTGYVGSEKIMTTMYPDSFWEIVQNGPKSGDSTIDPTPSLYDQIVAAAGTANAAAIAATQAREQLMQDKANGVFDGADGQAATVEVGTVITGSPEENAQVYATGTPQEVRLNFVIPRGKQGPKGEIGEHGRQGEPGKPGEKGDKGDPGVYVGSGDMPDGYSVQIDPDGDADRLVADISRGTDGTWEITYTDGTVETISDAGYQAIKVDTTLTKPGEAADAKATGDAISSLSVKIVTDVAEHNTGTDAHSDIRMLISGLTDRLNALADSDDTTLDQLSEVVAYIKANRELIASITTDKVSVTDIVNDLVTNVTNKPLSAAQGVVLKALIDAITIPDKLPNPNALMFTGAVSGSYDGSSPLEINIPSGGSSGGSGKAKTQKLIDITFTEPTASLSVTLEHNFHKLFLVWHCGEGGASRIVDADGNAASGKLNVCLDTTSFTWNDRKIAQMDANTSMWKTTASLIEYTDDLSTLLQSAVFEIITGSSVNIANIFGGYLAMIGTIGKDAMAPTAGRTVNIVTSTGFFATTTRIVLVGEYYE